MSETRTVSSGTKGAVAVILAVGFAIGLILGGFALMIAQGMEQTCARSGGTWTAHDAPVQAGATHDRKCQR